ncbi:MAG: N-acetylmuramoyl-L-alanine amidase [bacterium]
MFRHLTLWILCLVFVPTLTWAKPKLTDIRYWSAPDHTRVVLDLTQPVQYSILKPAPQLIIDLAEIEMEIEEKRWLIEDGRVEEVKLSKTKSGRVRVKLELMKETSFRLFALPPYAEKPNRLVIDCFKLETSEKPPPILSDGKKGMKTIVIDPGHGGEDPGAIGRKNYLKEKEVVLDIAQKLKSRLDRIPNLKVYLTRKGDYFLPLRKRIQAAREVEADLFVSIHTNANPSTRCNGSCVYILSLKGASDESSELLAEYENAADLVGGHVVEEENDMLTKILLDLAQTNTMNESTIAAKIVSDYIGTIGKTKNMGVKRANFVVLRSVDIPSILVETAFISNHEEERLLGTDGFRSQLAEVMARGISEYLGVVPQIHVVKSGENLEQIARNYGVSLQNIQRENQLEDLNCLSVGQKLRIPIE